MENGLHTNHITSHECVQQAYMTNNMKVLFGLVEQTLYTLFITTDLLNQVI